MQQILTATALLLAACKASADPRAEYLLHCAGCHLEQGQGMPPEIPDLRLPDVAVFAQDAEGRAYLMGVPGVAGAPLSDVGLTGVMNWMLATFHPDAQPPLFSVDEVQSLRGKALRDPLRRRAELAERLVRQMPGHAGSESALLP